MKPRVLINCPGGWSHGLDSPERGEGRWSQNLAKVLARSERYEVFATSGGSPTWGRGEVVPGVALMSEADANGLCFDIYIDASWYQGKPAIGTSRVCIHVYWTPEDWMFKVQLPKNHYILYVYRQMAPSYLTAYNVNPTFYLPAAFGPVMVLPDPSARRVLCFSRGRDAQTNTSAFEALYTSIQNLRQGQKIQFAWLHHDSYARHGHADDVSIVSQPGQPWGIPYNEQLTLIRGAGLNATFGGGGSIADCAIHGVPSLLREDAFSFVKPAAKAHDLLLPVDCSSTQLEDAICRLYCDSDLYRRYVASLQEIYSDHTDTNVLRLFDELVTKVL